MPSNTQRITAALATAAIFVGGAWFAAQFSTDISVASASSTGTQSDQGVVVNIHNVRNTNGKVIVMAFDNEAAFDQMDMTRAASWLELPANPVSQRIDFPELAHNYYALIAFHDENGDYGLNFSGDPEAPESWLPSEGYAISGINDLNEDPVFYYSLIEPGDPVDLGMFYWQ